MSTKNAIQGLVMDKGLPILFLFMLGVSSVYAQTMYVSDALRVGVRSEPSGSVAPHHVIVTGDTVEVLESRGGYYRIRTGDGKEGWVRKRYLMKDKPARIVLEEAGLEQGKQTDLVEGLQNELGATREKIRELKRINEQLERSRSDTGDATLPDEMTLWSVLGIVIAMAACLGFAAGLYWYRHRISRRLGGLTF